MPTGENTDLSRDDYVSSDEVLDRIRADRLVLRGAELGVEFRKRLGHRERIVDPLLQLVASGADPLRHRSVGVGSGRSAGRLARGVARRLSRCPGPAGASGSPAGRRLGRRGCGGSTSTPRSAPGRGPAGGSLHPRLHGAVRRIERHLGHRQHALQQQVLRPFHAQAQQQHVVLAALDGADGHAHQRRIGDAVRSDLRQVTLEDITAFANSTGDTFYAHTNHEAAEANPFFPGIVAHGYLLVSWAAGLFVEPAPGPVLANYGLENLRFVTPVSPGDSIRVELTAKQITPRETDEYGEVRWDVQVLDQDDAEGFLIGWFANAIEAGRSANPRPGTVRKLADAFGLTGDALKAYVTKAVDDYGRHAAELGLVR